MKLVTNILGFGCLFFATLAYGGYGSGTVETMMVGRNGHQVFIKIAGLVSDFPCASSHVNGYQYALSLSEHVAGKEILSTLLTAQAARSNVVIVGSAQCTVDPTMEDVHYITITVN